MKEELPYELIEQYVQGQLEGAELLAFEQKLATDNALKEEVGLFREVSIAIADPVLDSIEKNISEIEGDFFKTDYPAEGKRVKLQSRRWWMAVAAISVLLLGALFLFRLFNPTYEKLYAQYADHDFSFTERGNPNLINRIEQLLDAGQYKTALLLIESYLQTNPNETDLILAKGICHCELGEDYQKAITTFSSLPEINPIYINEANWYLALTYLKMKEKDECLACLKKIPESSNYFGSSQELIRQLNNID